MSTPSATARYVIAADDKTASAVRSVIKNFKDMERDIRGTAKTASAVLGAVIGIQVTQAFRKVIDATATASAGSSGFAHALREVKDAAADLLVAKSGLPEATKNMEALRDVLKDPAVKSGVDAIVSAMISGFSKVAKIVGEIVGGVRELTKGSDLAGTKTRGEVVEAFNKQISERQALIAQANSAEFLPNDERTKQIDQLQKEIDELKLRQERVLTGSFSVISEGRAGHPAPAPTSDEALRSALGDRLIREEDARHDQFMLNINQEIAAYKVSIVDHEQNTKAILNETDRYLDQQVAIRDQLEEIDLNAIEARKIFIKSVDSDLKLMDEIFKEAARKMFDVFEEFFFDPFRGGLKGLALGILDVIRHAIAAQSALATLKALGTYGNSGKGGVFGSILGALFGSYGESSGLTEVVPSVSKIAHYATGTDYVPRDGMAYLHQGEAVIPRSGNGRASVVINQYMDNRGATQDLIAQLPAFTKANNEALKADILDTLSRQRRRG